MARNVGLYRLSGDTFKDVELVRYVSPKQADELKHHNHITKFCRRCGENPDMVKDCKAAEHRQHNPALLLVP
jgi:hypothetical protein